MFFVSVFLSEWWFGTFFLHIMEISSAQLTKSYFSEALVYHQPVDLERIVKLHHSVFRCSSAVKSLGPSCGLSHKTHLTHPSHPFPLNAPERKLRFSMESIQLPESVVINLIIFYVFLNEDVDFGYPTQRQPTHFASSFVTKWVYRKMAYTTIYPSNNMEHCGCAILLRGPTHQVN